jgi:hypothetical protein
MPTSKEERVTLELWGFRAGVGGEGADLSGMGVHAVDGGLGKVQEVVERESRTFLVVDTGPWIFGKTIKLPAGLVSGVDPAQGIVFVDRPKDEVKSAPEQDGDLFDETAHEDALTRHYASAQDDGAAVPAPSGPPAADASTPAPGGMPPAGPGARPGAAPVDAGPAAGDLAGERDDDEAPSGRAAGDRESGEGRRRRGAADGVTSGPASSQSARDTEVDAAPALAGEAAPASKPALRRAGGRADAQDAAAPPAAAGRRTARVPEADDAPTSPSGRATGGSPAVEESAPESSPQRTDDSPREKRPRTQARPRDRAAERPDGAPAGKRAETAGTGKPATTGRKRAETPSTDKPAATGGKRAETASGDGSAAAPAKGKERGGKGARIDQPLARYDSLTAAEVVGRLRALTQSELAKVERYERQGNGRQTILRRVAALREQEPWRGYDLATVKEVNEKLARAKADRVTAVRDYERRHRNRRGVLDAARRRLESP